MQALTTYSKIFCPISMTDGAARVLELIGTPKMKKEVFARLVRYLASFYRKPNPSADIYASRDPSYAFTAGQWMTEVRTKYLS